MNAQLLERLARRLGWDVSTLHTSPLGGGLTNQNHRVSNGQEEVVVRLFGEGAAQLGINRAHELHCSQIAAQLGVGAEVLLAEDDLMVTRFIRGDTLTPEDAARRAPQVIAALKRTHEGPSFSGTFSPFETVRSYAQLAQQRGVLLPQRALEGLALMAQLESSLWPPPRLVPCHNDLLAGNFIDDGQRLRIIDWEYAGMGDPFFDLGNFASNQALDTAGCEALLRAYFGALRHEDLLRLRQLRQASDLREAFWGLLQSSLSTLDFDYLGYAQSYLDKFASKRAANTQALDSSS